VTTPRPVPTPQPRAGDARDGADLALPRSVVDAALDRAVSVPVPVIRRHVASLRARNPLASPTEIVAILEKEYARVLSTAGGAVGVVAAVPAVGTGTGLVLSSSDVATFFAGSAAFALAVAEVHGIEVADADRRRALLMASVLGAKGAATVAKASGGPSLLWGRAVLTSMPSSTLAQVNRALTNKFVRTQLAKQAGLTLGRVVPFGIGAVVGYAGGRALAHTVVVQARSAFGPPPGQFPPVLRVVEAEAEHAEPTLEPSPRPPHRSPLARLRRRAR
jgi:hypothetical protein